LHHLDASLVLSHNLGVARLKQRDRVSQRLAFFRLAKVIQVGCRGLKLKNSCLNRKQSRELLGRHSDIH
jgi:hypothetical protein